MKQQSSKTYCDPHIRSLNMSVSSGFRGIKQLQIVVDSENIYVASDFSECSGIMQAALSVKHRIITSLYLPKLPCYVFLAEF